MEGFNFKLQKLLDIREDKEEESKRYFKKAQMEKDEAESRLKTLRDNYNKYRFTSTGISLAEQKMKHIYLNALNSSIMEAASELQKKIKALEAKREELKQKQIERKTVEILKDKQLQSFIKEQALVEQKSNDEFALYGFIRANERR